MLASARSQSCQGMGSIGAAMGRIDQVRKRQRQAKENQPQHLRGDVAHAQ